MRYSPPTVATECFGLNRRPPLDALPADVRKVIEELDRINGEIVVATTALRALDDPNLDDSAAAKDAAAAVTAARAGTEMPGMDFAEQLSNDRINARRRVVALETAKAEIEGEAHAARWSINTPEGRTAADKATAKARAEITKAATRLADLIDTAIAARAVADWARSGSYWPRPEVSIIDVVPQIESRGFQRQDSPPMTVRSIIDGAVAAVMETESEHAAAAEANAVPENVLRGFV
jgi:hypothetical protein